MGGKMLMLALALVAVAGSVHAQTPVGTDLLKYHWGLHQSRFHNESVHATV